MRRSLTLIVAAAVTAAVSVASFVPAQAAPLRLVPPVTGSPSGAIIEVGGRWENFHGDRHSVLRDDGWRNRHHRRHRRHDRAFFPNQFYFSFPFAFVQPYHPYNRRHDCFRTWDGQLICR